MPTRRHFLSSAAVAAAIGLTGRGDAAPADAAPTKGPSETALALARSLRKSMPKAHLSDDLVKKIAGDIDNYDSTAADFRKATLHNWDEPDFVFTAGPMGSAS